ncbi:MAG TPA: glycosyltransferase [Caproicibacter sp.]|nr:glycosyltransferase [Caproicibacter sp.]
MPMKKKILYCASTVSHIMNFHLPYLKAFREDGYEVWVGTNEIKTIPYADYVVDLPFCKSMTSFQNVRAALTARKLIRVQKFDIISTHTMLASAVIRAAILFLHKRPKVYCTVHGYLFNEGDGLKRWKYLLPEKLCAHVTDVLMVMNHEDYAIAQKHKLYHGKLRYINGMGVDLTKFPPITDEEHTAARTSYSLAKTDVAYVYAAEFSKRKNQAFLIKSFSVVCQGNSHMKLFLAGEGVLLEKCKQLTRELGISNQVCFPGYINNIRNLYAACDVCISTSLCEGLPFNILEALACGLPVIASDIKGHRELIEGSKLNFLVSSSNELQEKMLFFLHNNENLNSIKNNAQKIENFGLEKNLKQIMKIYRN